MFSIWRVFAGQAVNQKEEEEKAPVNHEDNDRNKNAYDGQDSREIDTTVCLFGITSLW